MPSGPDIFGKELERVLRKLPEKVLNKVARQAVNAGATPVLKAARKNVPVDQAVLKKTLTKKTKVFKNSQTAISLVGPKARAAPHDHLAESGTTERRTKKGKRTGRMPASRFLAKSMDENRAASLDAIKSKMAKGIEQEAAKLGG